MAALTPLSSVQQIVQDGALSYELFNLSTQAALDALVAQKQLVATGWLQRRTPNFYASTDAQVLALLGQAESYFTLHLLIPILRAQKVYGTHRQYISEESGAYDQLVETDYRAMAVELLDEFAVTDDRDAPFAAPVFLSTASIDPLADTESQEQQLSDILAAAGSPAPFTGSPQFGLTGP